MRLALVQGKPSRPRLAPRNCLLSAQFEASKAAICNGRFTSKPAVAGQRSTAGFSLQVGNDCSSGSVCSEGEDRL